MAHELHATTKLKATARRRGQHRRIPGPAYSEAARRLWHILDERGLDTAGAAERVRTTTVTVLRWLYGDRRADAAGQLACRQAFGLEPELWFRDVPSKYAKALPTPKAPAPAAAE